MAKAISASNAVMNAIEQTAAIYGVRSYRMQSRMFRVPGKGGVERPMFIGQWKDDLGVAHFKGMADMLLTPRITLYGITREQYPITFAGKAVDVPVKQYQIAVALWVECKSGGATLKKEQCDFRDDVLKAGAFWLQARDSADVVIEWFQQHGVSR